MPLVYTTDCPHCPASHAPMVFQSEHPISDTGTKSHHFALVFACPRCHSLVVVEITLSVTTSSFASQKQGELTNHNVHVHKVYPQRGIAVAPEHIPESVGRC